MKKLLILCVLLLTGHQMSAQDTDDLAQANNPLANMTAINLHNYYIPRLTDAPTDAYQNTAWLRFAKPFAAGKFLMRASLPLNSVGIPSSSGVEATSGLGDFNVLFTYNFISKPTATVGIGPLIAAPTATDELLGAGKWQLGFASVFFIAKTPQLQVGGLITWQASVAGDEDRRNTNLGALQPFLIWQLGNGTYMRSSGIWVFDFENNAYTIPIGLGIGKVVVVGNKVFNLFFEPQYSILHEGTMPMIQLFMGINLQLLGG